MKEVIAIFLVIVALVLGGSTDVQVDTGAYIVLGPPGSVEHIVAPPDGASSAMESPLPGAMESPLPTNTPLP